MEIDTVTARQLSTDIKELTVGVAELKVSFAQFGPILQQQVNGMANVENRTTRLEDRYDALTKRLAEEKTEAEKRTADEKVEMDKRIASNRWLITATFTAVGLAVTLLLFFLQHVKVMP